MTETRKMIEQLRSDKHVDPSKIADKLECFIQLIDDIYNDHYVDTLEWYVERCMELEEENEKLKEGRK